MEIKIIKSDDYSVTLTMDNETFEEKMFTCPDCGRTHFICDGVRVDGEYYCYSCVTTCDLCGSTIRREDAYSVSDSGYDYCENCYNDQMITCSGCHERFRYIDDLREDYDGNYFCDECWEKRRTVLNDYHTQKEYGVVKFFGNADRRDEVHIGWELEVDSDHRVDRERIASGVKERLSDYVCLEYDSSLNFGFEVISQVGSLDYNLSLMPKFKETFEFLIENEMLSHDAGTCGLHIHLDRKFFGNKEDSSIAKLLYLFEKFRPEIMTFSRRTEEAASSWARSRKQNYGGEVGWIKKAVLDSKGYLSYQNRYYAVNLTNADTIELRIFRGTLNVQTFEATLRFATFLAKLCKNTPAVRLAKMTFEDILLSSSDEVVLSYWNRINSK